MPKNLQAWTQRETALRMRDISRRVADMETIETLVDSFLRGAMRLVDKSYASTTEPRRYGVIQDAIDAAVGGDSILIASDTFEEDVTFTGAATDILMVGSGMPRYDDGTGRLINGTIIRGTVDTGTKPGLVIAHLGIDLVGVDNTDAIAGSNSISGKIYRCFEYLTILGNGYDALSHGIYGIGDVIDINNCHIINCHHGIAIHGSFVNISDCYFYKCSGTSLVLKSKGSLNVHHVNVNNIVIEGDDSSASFKDWGGPIAIQCDSSQTTRSININNVSAYYCVNGVIQITRPFASGSISNIFIDNVHSDSNQDFSSVGDFWIKSGDIVVMTNCSSTNRAAGVGFNRDDSDDVGAVYVYSSFTDGTPAAGSYTGDFEVLELNGRYWRPLGVIWQPNAEFRGMKSNGCTSNGAISVTGANTPVAALTNAGGSSTNDYAGKVQIWVRASTTSAGQSAYYEVSVYKPNSGSTECTLVVSNGATSGASAGLPSFTFSVDGTNNHLEATPVGSTSGSFYFVFLASGYLTIRPI